MSPYIPDVTDEWAVGTLRNLGRPHKCSYLASRVAQKHGWAGEVHTWSGEDHEHFGLNPAKMNQIGFLLSFLKK